MKGQSFYGQIDPSTGAVSNISTDPSSGTKIFEITSDGKLYLYKALDSLTVYANWGAEEVNYTVVYWLQNADDDDYTLMYYKNMKGVAGAQTAAAETTPSETYVLDGITHYPYTENNLKFMHLSSDQDKEAAGTQSGIQQQVIDGDGSTIVNIYYDRNVYRLRFDIGFSRTTGGTLVYESMTSTEASAYTGTVYGIVNGSYVPLASDGNGGWNYYGSIRHDYNGDRYAVTTANNNNPPQYGIVNGAVQRVYYRNGRWRITDNNNGTQYTGTRYTQGTGNNYNQGFVNGTMLTLSNDAQGWYYTTQDTVPTPYSGALYKQSITGGTTNYYVSNLTNSYNTNPDDRWENFLTNNTVNLGTTNPFSTSDYNGTYISGTEYTVYYYDIVAKYGETILDKYPGSQTSKRNGNTTYSFVGWIPQADSFYWERVMSSIKGFFDTMSDDLILTGNPSPRQYQNNGGNANASPDNFVAVTIEGNNTVTGDYGVTQEFRCRYKSGNGCNYLYRIYLADPETGTYPSEPTAKILITAGSGSNPTSQTAPSYHGYTLADKKVLSSENDTTGSTPGGTYSAYYVTELNDAGIGNGMIMVFRFQPNRNDLTFKYGSGADSSLVGTEIGSAQAFNYNQSLANADIPNADAEAATPPGYYFDGWYENPDGVGNKFDFNTTMPDGKVVLYAVYKPLKFRVMVNPNGAEIDHIDHTGNSYSIPPFNRADNGEYPADSGYNGSQATYINADYGVTISEYGVSRDKVPIGDVAAENYSGRLYYYVNGQYTSSDGPGVPSHLRNALYIDVTDGAGVYVNDDQSQGYTELYQYYEFWHQYALIRLNQNPDDYIGMTAQNLSYDAWKNLYVQKQADGVNPQLYRKCNSQESWVFLGWFKDNETMPYNFNTPVESAFTLTAHWRLDGGYTIQYMPEYWLESSDSNRYLINGAMQAWIDPDPQAATGAFSYTDGAATTVYKQPTDLTKNGEEITDNSINFLGWRVVSVSRTTINGQIVETYTPLEDGVLYDPGDDFVIDVQYADSNNIIHMQAVYEETNSSVRRPNIANLKLDANGG